MKFAWRSQQEIPDTEPVYVPTKEDAERAKAANRLIEKNEKFMFSSLVTIGLGSLAVTMASVFHFAVGIGMDPWVAWLPDLLLNGALTTMLIADGNMSRAGGYKATRWSLALRWYAGLATAILNSWTSFFPSNKIEFGHMDPGGIVLHLSIPGLLILIAEAISHQRKVSAQRIEANNRVIRGYEASLREARAAAEEEAREEERRAAEHDRSMEASRLRVQSEEAERGTRERIARENREAQERREAAAREAAEKKAREDREAQERLAAIKAEADREAREAEERQAREARDHEARMAREAREAEERQAREARDAEERKAREESDRQAREAREEADRKARQADDEAKVVKAKAEAEALKIGAEAQAKALLEREAAAREAEERKAREAREAEERQAREAEQAKAREARAALAPKPRRREVSRGSQPRLPASREAGDGAPASLAANPARKEGGDGEEAREGAKSSREALAAKKGPATYEAAKLIVAVDLGTLEKLPTAAEFGALHGASETWGGDCLRDAKKNMLDPTYRRAVEDDYLEGATQSDEVKVAR
ncbi:hypothetical protein ACFC1T_08745 [Kitasatospora sp. NPDC056076]|uniref:hypothetical protein n=1 Tax=Kitasatospora sp. NPDC056076 TaxID=3345703 RepID=UPI0035DED265